MRFIKWWLGVSDRRNEVSALRRPLIKEKE